MRVRGQTAAGVRDLLAETVELVLGETTLEESSGVDAGGGVALEEHLVATAGVIGTAEEVVEAHLVERRRRRVAGDVAADGDAGALGAMHHDRGVPADDLADAVLDRFIAGEPRLALRRNRVDVVGAAQARQTHVSLRCSSQQREHHVAGAVVATLVDQLVEGFHPFGGLIGVDIDVLSGQTTRK